MRLWHEDLLPYLSQQRILGQHRECCALRGKGWDKKHETVNYVFGYRPMRLVMYHFLLMDLGEELHDIDFNSNWFIPFYRGQKLGYDQSEEWMTTKEANSATHFYDMKPKIYPEHNHNYLLSCINNLESKGVDMSQAKQNLLEEVA